MVLRATAAGEYDRRITLLTRERGKITAFARGARRPGSALVAATVPFAFGRFRVYEGKSAYTCVAAEIRNYFETLKTDFIGACYGAYFMEFADYYAQENLDGTDMLNLLYVSLLALEKEEIPYKKSDAPGLLFDRLIKGLAAANKGDKRVVVLVDEYDHPFGGLLEENH